MIIRLPTKRQTNGSDMNNDVDSCVSCERSMRQLFRSQLKPSFTQRERYVGDSHQRHCLSYPFACHTNTKYHILASPTILAHHAILHMSNHCRRHGKRVGVVRFQVSKDHTVDDPVSYLTHHPTLYLNFFHSFNNNLITAFLAFSAPRLRTISFLEKTTMIWKTRFSRVLPSLAQPSSCDPLEVSLWATPVTSTAAKELWLAHCSSWRYLLRSWVACQLIPRWGGWLLCCWPSVVSVKELVSVDNYQPVSCTLLNRVPSNTGASTAVSLWWRPIREVC